MIVVPGAMRKATTSLLTAVVLTYGTHAVAAGAWDNFVNSATSSVLDATRNSLNSAMQGTTSGQPTQPAQPQQQQSQQARPATQAATQAAARNPSSGGSLPCIAETTVDSNWTSVRNGCSQGVWVISTDGKRCAPDQISAGHTSRRASFLKSFAVCRWVGKVLTAADCLCPAGSAITAGDAVAVTFVSSEDAGRQLAADTANGLDRHGCPLRKDDPRWAEVPPGLPKGRCRAN